jgi:hypothetical protein
MNDACTLKAIRLRLTRIAVWMAAAVAVYALGAEFWAWLHSP